MDPNGERLATVDKFGKVLISEVDTNKDILCYRMESNMIDLGSYNSGFIFSFIDSRLILFLFPLSLTNTLVFLRK